MQPDKKPCNGWPTILKKLEKRGHSTPCVGTIMIRRSISKVHNQAVRR